MMAEQWGLSRTDLDQFSLDSHEKAAAAQDSGLRRPDRRHQGPRTATRPQGRGHPPRHHAGEDGPAQARFSEDGVIHAGNSSQISDGSAALLFMSAEKAKSLGLKPLARVHTAALAGADPVMMLSAPIPATQKALKRSRADHRRHRRLRGQRGVRPGSVAWLKEIGADEKKLNPNGGAIALGHPLGGSGARIMTTLLYHMRATAFATACRPCARAAARPTPPSSNCSARKGATMRSKVVGSAPPRPSPTSATAPRSPSADSGCAASRPCSSTRCSSPADRPSGGVQQLRRRRLGPGRPAAGQAHRPDDLVVRRREQGVRAPVPHRRARGRADPAGHAGRAAARRRAGHPRVLHARRRRHPGRRRRDALALRRRRLVALASPPRRPASSRTAVRDYVLEQRHRHRLRARARQRRRPARQPRVRQEHPQLQPARGHGRPHHDRRGRASSSSPARSTRETIHMPGVFVQRVVALTPEQAADKRIERRTGRASEAMSHGPHP